MSGFKIVNIEVKDNTYLGDLDLQFINLNEIDNGPYFTLLIGPNGTGKSNILKLIINLFRDLNNYRNTGSFGGNVKNRFGIEYTFNNKSYFYSNFIRTEKFEMKLISGEHPKKLYSEIAPGKRKFISDDIRSLSLDDVVIPKKIIASSIMLTDKYPIVNDKKENFSEYRYLGVRRLNSPGTAGTQTYINRTVENIADCLNNSDFKQKVKDILSFLDLEEKFVIQFTPRYRKLLFNKDITIEKLDSFFKNREGLKRQTELWGKSYYDKMTDRERELIVEFCKNIESKLIKPYEGAFSKVIEYDIMGQNSLSEDYDKISHLRKLDLLTYPYFKISKKGRDIDAEESSSGEAHFISSIISIVANIEDNSLILIDEPEISLHPNWQMKYIHFLNELFKEYKGCHFVICTHSHFLISDLYPQNSKLIGLNRTEELRVVDFEGIADNTFGWSAEEILYSIFNVRSTRNSYLEFDLTKLVTMINRSSSDFQEISRILAKVSTLVLSENDPLKIIIEKAEKYMRNSNA